MDSNLENSPAKEGVTQDGNTEFAQDDLPPHYFQRRDYGAPFPTEMQQDRLLRVHPEIVKTSPQRKWKPKEVKLQDDEVPSGNETKEVFVQATVLTSERPQEGDIVKPVQATVLTSACPHEGEIAKPVQATLLTPEGMCDRELVEPVQVPALFTQCPTKSHPPDDDVQNYDSGPEHEEHFQQTGIEVDTDSSTVEVHPPQLTHRQQAARETILTKLYKEVEDMDDEGEIYTDSCCENCSNILCITCSCPRCSTDRKLPQATQLLETEALRKGRIQGSKNFADAVFPLVPDVLRILWVIIEFGLAVTGLILSVATISLNQNRGFTILHLVLTILACILAGIDAIYNLKNSTTLQKLCCRRRTDNDHTQDVTGCKQKCCSYLTDLLDILRLILSEAILYPLLICDIFELIVGQGFNGESSGDHLGFALFIVSLISLVLTVYLARIIVLVGMIKNANAVRSPTRKMIDTDTDYDADIKRSAVYYQAIFCIHVGFQMLVQSLMYVAIAAKIRYDNRHFYAVGNSNEEIQVTSFLWYMMAAAYVLPTMGLFTFFIVTYYWSQQYPVGYRIDMISIFKMTEYGMTDLSRIGEEITQKNEKMLKALGGEVEGKRAKIIAKMDGLLFKPLQDDFQELFRKNWGVKFLYPFKTPMLVFACFVYFALQLAFVVCAAQSVDEMGEVVTHVLNGGGWVYYYISAVIVTIIANLYTFLVVGLWIAVITAVVITIVPAITYCIITCVLVLLCRSSDC